MAKVKKKVVRQKAATGPCWFEVIDGRVEVGIDDVKANKTKSVFTKGQYFQSALPWDDMFKNKVKKVDPVFAARLARKADMEEQGLEEVDEEEEILDEEEVVEDESDEDEDEEEVDEVDDETKPVKKKKKKKKVK